MSDDEYFDDDDIFTSAELDNIPLLNQPPETQAIRTVASSSTAVLVHDTPGATRSNPIVISNESSNVASGSSTRQHMDGSRNVQQRSAPSTSNPVNHSNQSSGSRRPLQNQERPASNRFSAIMTALQRSTQSGSSSEQPLVSKKSIFGAPNDLLRASSPRPSSHSSRNKRDSPSSSDGSGGSVTPRKRARRSPSRGKKRRRSSSCSLSSKAHLDTIAQDSKAQGKEEVWGIIEEESTCAICYDIYVAPQLTPCGHTACAPCIKLWLARKSSCPICRTALNPSQKLTNNLYCANIIDRLFSDAPEWCVGGTKRVEWDKRKQSWDQQASAINVRQYQPIPARPPPGVYGPPPAVARRPLFNPESDSDGEDTDYEYADVYNLPQNIFYVFD